MWKRWLPPADGMKNIWMKYMEKLLNIENDWDGEKRMIIEL